tara:strand:- start:245 stop:637 length:393 start_codon:yes stop_codon:yes gene_type:complete
MVNKILRPAGVWKSDLAGFAQGVKSSGTEMVFVAGQVGIDASGNIVGEDIESQVKQSFENMKMVLQEAGASFNDITKMNVFLTNIGDLAKYSEIKAAYFSDGLPASTVVEVKNLARPELKVEVEATAIIE